MSTAARALNLVANFDLTALSFRRRKITTVRMKMQASRCATHRSSGGRRAPLGRRGASTGRCSSPAPIILIGARGRPNKFRPGFSPRGLLFGRRSAVSHPPLGRSSGASSGASSARRERATLGEKWKMPKAEFTRPRGQFSTVWDSFEHIEGLGGKFPR